MTDSASIFSVGLNGFEILFEGLTDTGLAVVGVIPVASLVTLLVESAVAGPGESSVAAPIESSVVTPGESSAACSAAFASLSSGFVSGVCALAAPEWSAAVSAVASAADTNMRIARVMGRRVYFW
ncbi:MAG: hypothetical protein ACC649_00500 [Myxococcota bacterium]